METARALVANETLWPKLRAFLWDFAPLVHPSHLSGGKAIAQDASPRVKRWILSAHDVEPFFHDFPADDGSRLALLGAETFDQVAKWLGALHDVAGLRRVMRRKDVMALRKGLEGVYPAVFGYEAYFARDPDSPAPAADAPLPTAESVARDGYAMLSGLLAPLPPPLLRRLRLVLPADAPWPEEGSAPALPPVPLSRVLKLLKLRFPEASALCSS